MEIKITLKNYYKRFMTTLPETNVIVISKEVCFNMINYATIKTNNNSDFVIEINNKEAYYKYLFGLLIMQMNIPRCLPNNFENPSTVYIL